ncbi:PRC-barrel domain-containing protein [Candidatus Marsarchaeota archaeon]|jgi:sporulation protein YlmC with PRC-barrel domain|nr:PRC-barrel domain-containing protein [Candidatus Marsarchaeota archaeon]
MAILLSELYGKQIITNEGKKIGMVEDAILDFDKGAVANLLLIKSEELTRSANTAMTLAKNSVKYERIKSVSESIIVSAK